MDIFFASLAVDCKENAVGIVVSGGDGDRVLGVKMIKEYGGFTFAHTSARTSPGNSEMPDAAIATGFVDFAVPVEKMGEKLLQL